MSGPGTAWGGVPPDRVWLPVDGPDSAWAALCWLYRRLRTARPGPRPREIDRV